MEGRVELQHDDFVVVDRGETPDREGVVVVIGNQNGLAVNHEHVLDGDEWEGEDVTAVSIQVIWIVNIQQINHFFFRNETIGISVREIHFEDLLELSSIPLSTVSLNHQVFVVIDHGEIADRVVRILQLVIAN